MDFTKIALAGYKIVHPFSRDFPDDSTKNIWISVAQEMLKGVSESLIDDDTFIAKTKAIVEFVRCEKSVQQNNVLELSRLYHKMHPNLSAAAIWNYALAVNCLRDHLLQDKDDHLVDDLLLKLVELPIDILDRINSLPRELRWQTICIWWWVCNKKTVV